MAQSKAATVEAYLAELPPDRRERLAAVRDTVLRSLPRGYEETMQHGMITYVVPSKTLPVTYNGQPLVYAALASQKNCLALYLMSVYGDPDTNRWFRDRFDASGKKLDMGKSCLRFKKLDDLPLDLIGETVARTPVDQFVQRYQASRRGQARSTAR